MPINWQDKDVADRLLAAIIASQDNKINCTEVARLYGEGATYNAIENFLRKPKKVAAQLKAEAEGRETPAASPARKARASPVKKSGGAGVKTGRVEKKKKTPRKKEVKVEEGEEEVVEDIEESVEFEAGATAYGHGVVEEGLEEYV